MSNESGVPVDAELIVSVARHALRPCGSAPRPSCRSSPSPPTPWPSCTSAGWTSRAPPTSCRSRWTSWSRSPGGPTRPTWARRCSATSCCARSSPRRRPARPGHSLDDELHLLTVHGVLHLLGYDHAEPDEEREMFALQATLLADWRRSRSAAAARAAQRRSDSAVLGTVGLDDPDRHDDRSRCSSSRSLLVPVAGLFAAADAALNSVSRAHVESLVREGTPGARALAKVVADRPRHVNLLLLLRLAAETTATVLVTVAFVQIFATPVGRGAGGRGGDGGGVATSSSASAPARWVASTPTASAWLLAAPGAGARHPARAAVAAAHRDRQHGHARAGLPGGPVLVRDRAARAGRHGQHVRRRRRGRAPDDPLGVRAGRHVRPRRHGAPPRRRVDRARHHRREGRCGSR